MIQLRNVPDALHRALKARAAQEGLTLSDLLVREARRLVAQPSAAELAVRLAALPAVRLRESPAETIRALRDDR